MELLRVKKGKIIKNIKLDKSIETVLGVIDLFVPIKSGTEGLNSSNLFGGNSVDK